ncbi:MAG: TldD/PmbA family protein [Alphaproteobacteria bacterium]|nr:TldD/PmbA family protein [Alphaproteobacteria bacterium]
MSLLDTAAEAVRLGQAAGADQVKAVTSRSTHVDLQQREGRLERCTEAATLSLSVSLLVDERYSTHSTSDLRPDALSAFIQRAVDATRYLEPDPDRAMLPVDEMGTLDPSSLDTADDAAFAARTPEASRDRVSELERAIQDQGPEDLVSATAYAWEVRSEGCTVYSNGFQGRNARTWFGWGGHATIREPDGKLPEAYNFVSASHLSDLPERDIIVADLLSRVDQTRKAGPAASGRYPMLLDNRAAGRLLGAVLRPLSGVALHERRSVFLDKLDQAVAAPHFTLWDDPTVPRGLGSRPYDADGLKAQRRPIFEDGVLRTWFLDVYHARKLERAPTTGQSSNLVVTPGMRSWQQIAADLPRAIRVTSFLGGNSNPASGDFSFGIRGQLLEHGEPVANLSEMNISGNLVDLLADFVEAADDPWVFSSSRLPTLLFDGVQFSGT